jgi:hypothetical protein
MAIEGVCGREEVTESQNSLICFSTIKQLQKARKEEYDSDFEVSDDDGVDAYSGGGGEGDEFDMSDEADSEVPTFRSRFVISYYNICISLFDPPAP